MSIHDDQHVLRGGAPLARARTALLLIHGRGASAEDIYSLGEEIAAGTPGVALIAPQAPPTHGTPSASLRHPRPE